MNMMKVGFSCKKCNFTSLAMISEHAYQTQEARCPECRTVLDVAVFEVLEGGSQCSSVKNAE